MTTHTQSGYVTLMSVIVLGAIAVSIVVMVLTIGTDMLRGSKIYQDSSQSHALASSCAERALGVIRDSTSFTGTGSISYSAGSCSYVVSNTGGSTRQINASSSVSNAVSRVQVQISDVAPVTVSMWRDVASF